MRKSVIKWTILPLLTLLFTSFVLQDSAIPPQSIPPVEPEICYINNGSFQVGEEITYKLYYNWNFIWLPAGEVVFKVAETDGQYHIVAKGRTYKSYEWFFKVRDTYESYVDKETLLPSTSVRNVSEGKYRLYDQVTFDQESNKAVSLRGKTQAEAVSREYPIDGCMHDVLSIIYYARNLAFDDYSSGQEFPVKIFMDKEVWPLQVKYKGKEASKKVKGKGRFNTIKFSPEVIEGTVFEKGAEMNVWVSDDQNRIPLLIESPVSVGSVKAVLKSYKGLRHDFTAKVK